MGGCGRGGFVTQLYNVAPARKMFMKRFLLIALLLLGTVNIAAASCYYVATKWASTHEDAMRYGRGYFKPKNPKYCRFNTPSERLSAKQPVWICSNITAEVCGQGNIAEDLNHQDFAEWMWNRPRMPRQIIPSFQEGTYESWPSREQYECTRAFGCVRHRNLK
jgi:hypothetical protein